MKELWQKLTDEEKAQVLFRIRADLFIDEVPISVDDLNDLPNLSGEQLLKNLLGIDSWDALIASALEEGIELKKLSTDLQIRFSVDSSTYVCQDCQFAASRKDFMEVEETSELICPDCESTNINKE